MRRTPKNVAERLCIDEDQAAAIIGLMNGSIDPEEYESVQRWIRQCYRKPRDVEMRMCAIDEVLETCGVEAIRRDGSWDNYHGDIVATYCNTGEMHASTVLFDTRSGKFKIMCQGGFR